MQSLSATFDELKELFNCNSRLEGRFQLASGAWSDTYFDSKLTTTTPEGAVLLGKLIYKLLENTDVEAIGGPAHSAIPIATAAAIASNDEGRSLPSFYVREEKKEHGTKKLIEGSFPRDAHAKVAITDDVVTSGGSIIKAIDAAKDAGAIVSVVLVVIDRHAGGCEKLRADGYNVVTLFEMGADGYLSISNETVNQLAEVTS